MRLGKKKTFMDHAAEFAETAMESLESAYESARDNAKEAGQNAKDAAGPVFADAKDRAVPLLAEGRAVATEKATAGAAIAREKAAAGASLAAEQASSGRDLAGAKLAQLQGKPEPEKGGRLKKFLLVSGLLAIGGLVFKSLRDKQANDNWQSSYVPPAPTAAPVPTPSPTDGLADPLNDPLPGQGDDPGGAGPDEAMSDASEEPHAVTTPDDPADVVEVNPDGTSKK